VSEFHEVPQWVKNLRLAARKDTLVTLKSHLNFGALPVGLMTKFISMLPTCLQKVQHSWLANNKG